MPRRPRQKSALGIYHVMLRGINKQDIFFTEDDFRRMMSILSDIPFKRNQFTGEIISSNQCTVYAYCILHNHVHVLIKENDANISDIMKTIEQRYVQYYNRKYERVGHLFQSRYLSEAVNDSAYFHTVFRYIALNPVKAMESKTAEDYPYSSWNEYVGNRSNVMKVLKPSAIQAVIKKYPLQELSEWINTPNDDHCLDMDSCFNVKSDKEAWEILSDSCNLDNPEDFRLLDPQTQLYYLLDAIQHGINISQASRLGTLSRFQITRAYARKFGEKLTSGPGPVVRNLEKKVNPELDEIHNAIRMIPGQGKHVYHRLHLIVEYLFSNGCTKCTDLSKYLDISTETVRKCLILLANENIVEISGTGRNCVYCLKNLEKN